MKIEIETKYSIGDKVYVRPNTSFPDDIRLGEVEHIELYVHKEETIISYRVSEGWRVRRYDEECVFETKEACRLYYKSEREQGRYV